MPTVTDFENYIGKGFEEFTEADIPALTNTEEVEKFYQNPELTLQICNQILEVNQNKEIRDQFLPVKYHNEIYLSQNKIGKIFKETEKDIDKRVKELEELFTNENPCEILNATLICLNAFSDFPVEDYKDSIIRAINSIVDIIYSLKMDYSFPIIGSLLDMVFGVRELYFQRYNEDIMPENEEMKEYLDKLNKFAQPIYDKLKDELDKEIPENATPEDAGLIDITKLKDGGE